MCRLVPARIDTLVVSSGGVGTTFLMEFLQEYRKVNCPYDTDGLKHLPAQPVVRDSNVKMIFVYGEPVEQVLSLFRRGYHATQARKLNPILRILRYRISHTTTLQEYVEGEVDLIGIERHVRHWFANPLGYDLLLLKYETIWDNLDELFEFLEVSPTKPFPAKRKRTTKIDDIPEPIVDGLRGIYRGLIEEVDSMAPAIELPSQPHRRRFANLMRSKCLWNMPAETLYQSLRRLASQTRP